LISTNLKSGMPSSDLLRLRHFITSYTVAVFPVPDTPDMYRHLQTDTDDSIPDYMQLLENTQLWSRLLV